MSDDWMRQQVSSTSETPDTAKAGDDNETSESSGATSEDFEKRLRTLLAREAIDSVSVDALDKYLGDIEDHELLWKACEQASDDGVLEAFEERFDAVAPRDDDPEPIDREEVYPEGDEALERHENAPKDENGDPDFEAEESTVEEPDDETPEAVESVGETASGSDNDSESEHAVVPADAKEDPAEDESADDPPAPEPKPAFPGVGVAAESTESNETDNTGTDESKPALSNDGGVVDVKSIAPNVITSDEAAERDRRWSMMVWADPGQGKTHFGMTATSPVVLIDTEGKADELAHKFRGKKTHEGEPFIFQPTDYTEVLRDLKSALELLDTFREATGDVGTIVIDSMSIMWEWAQQHYVEKFHPQAEGPHEVEFKTGFGSGKSDWKVIKNYHNIKFRQVMLDSPYHLVWTAMAEDDYKTQLEDDDRTAQKPSGEGKNVYKVDEVLRIREGPDGAPMGELHKSGKVKHRYTGLRYPTFDKHREIIEAIDKAERGRGTVENVEQRFGVRVVEGNPQYVGENNE